MNYNYSLLKFNLHNYFTFPLFAYPLLSDPVKNELNIRSQTREQIIKKNIKQYDKINF